MKKEQNSKDKAQPVAELPHPVRNTHVELEPYALVARNVEGTFSF